MADVELPNSEQLQDLRDTDENLGDSLQMFPPVYLHRRQLLGLVAAQEEVLADKRRLTAELDQLLNGDGAAKAPSLCDIIGQLRRLVTRHGVNFLLLAELKAQSDAGMHYDDCDCVACNPPRATPESVQRDIADQLQEKP